MKAAAQGYFGRRWHGHVPAAVLLWRDMIVIGTLINLAASFMALVLLSQGVRTAVAAAIHFGTMPYNVFLLMAFWRSERRTRIGSMIALLWFIFVTLV